MRISFDLNRWPLPVGVATLGIAAHAIIGWGHIHGQVSVLDEGLYLYKGLLFAAGRFKPFADFGPYTNHMPLSFLIPGWVQLLFGPGIRTGRMMALLLGIIMLVGVWIVARRLGGAWWAALAIWMIALNPFLSKIYSQATSQILVVTMLIWVMVLALGKDRPAWQPILGSVLAGLIALTRINLMPVLVLLIPYVFWVHGRKVGLFGLAGAVSVVGFGHLLFWPDILKLWSYWIPRSLTPFLDQWREPINSIVAWDPQYAVGTRTQVFITGMRRHLAPVLGVFGATIAWLGLPKKDKFSGESKTAVFLISLFLLLTAVHAWASLANNYCVFCFQTYLAFFSPLGLLALALMAKEWLPLLSQRFQIFLLLAALLLALMLGFRDFSHAAETLASMQLPRMSQFKFLPGTVVIELIMEQRFNISPSLLKEFIRLSLSMWFLITLASLIYLGYRLLARGSSMPISPRLVSIIFALLVFWVSANQLFTGIRFGTYDCGKNVIQAIEEVGATLDRTIESGANVYWQGSLSPAPLTYVSDVDIYPPQLNRVYSYRLNGQSEALFRLGLWNPELANEWLKEADYLLVSNEYHDQRLLDALQYSEFDESNPTQPTNPCRPETAIRIYRRIR